MLTFCRHPLLNAYNYSELHWLNIVKSNIFSIDETSPLLHSRLSGITWLAFHHGRPQYLKKTPDSCWNTLIVFLNERLVLRTKSAPIMLVVLCTHPGSLSVASPWCSSIESEFVVNILQITAHFTHTTHIKTQLVILVCATQNPKHWNITKLPTSSSYSEQTSVSIEHQQPKVFHNLKQAHGLQIYTYDITYHVLLYVP